MKALSIRQPWAWLVVNGYKDIENRTWSTRRRERIWIHASSKTVTKQAYEEFLTECRRHRIKKFPQREDFKTSGIVGSVEIVDCVESSRSSWFGGPYGFVMKNARKTKFKPMHGKLNFFEVNPPA